MSESESISNKEWWLGIAAFTLATASQLYVGWGNPLAWWFRTDACPKSTVTCGQPAPILFPVGLGVFGITVIAHFSLRRWADGRK